jgi:ribosomal protein L9
MYLHKSSILLAIFASSKFMLALAAPTTISASFVPPAAPSVIQSTPAPTEIAFARIQAISNGYGVYPSSSSNTALNGKKKSSGPAPTKKVQVKLLKHVAGSGQAGDVIQVTPAFFNNKLRANKSAILISDEEVDKQRIEGEEKGKEIKAKATELQAKLSETTLIFSRKAGPDGQLFGGIGPKNIMSELQGLGDEDFLDQKWVKISEILDENGKKIRGDIKHTGEFAARVVLAKDISAKFAIVVKAED